jgi:replication factor A1
MEIKDLQAKQGSVEVVGEITEKGDVREFNKFGKSGRVCNAKLKDASGEIKLSLWNEQIDQVNVGDMVRITNGYVSEWQGELQLTTGKFGNLEIEGKSEAPKPNPEEMKTDEGSHILSEDEKTEEEVLEEGVGEKPSLESSESEDEATEEEISIEEEEIK